MGKHNNMRNKNRTIKNSLEIKSKKYETKKQAASDPQYLKVKDAG